MWLVYRAVDKPIQRARNESSQQPTKSSKKNIHREYHIAIVQILYRKHPEDLEYTSIDSGGAALRVVNDQQGTDFYSIENHK